MTTPTPEPLTTEEVDDTVHRLGVLRTGLDAEYRLAQDRLQKIGTRRAVVEDAILTLATAGRLLRETALVRFDPRLPWTAVAPRPDNDGAS